VVLEALFVVVAAQHPVSLVVAVDDSNYRREEVEGAETEIVPAAGRRRRWQSSDLVVAAVLLEYWFAAVVDAAVYIIIPSFDPSRYQRSQRVPHKDCHINSSSVGTTNRLSTGTEGRPVVLHYSHA
jgi:hypothetical protein